MKKLLTHLFLLSLLAVLVLPIVGCEREEGPVEDAVENISDEAEDAGEAIDEGMEDMGGEMEEGMEEMEEGMEEMGEEMGEEMHEEETQPPPTS